MTRFADPDVQRLVTLRNRLVSPSSPPLSPAVPASAGAGHRLTRIDFWSKQVALRGYDLTCTDFSTVNNRRIARRVAIVQFEAARES